MAWTPSQQQAINEEGNNIIVSAGAGSGKTAVLTERVIRKLKSGIHINELLVLTFTNAAAAEMKDRIRKAIRETKGLEKENAKIDSAYITTFDSFALSVVKKYHTIINCTNKIEITDDVVIDLKKRELLDKILDEKYLLQDKRFTKLIHDFCYKDDKELKKDLLAIYQKIELKYDKEKFLNTYIENYTTSFKKVLNDYQKSIAEKLENIKEALQEMSFYFEGKYMEKVEDYLKDLLTKTTYEEQKQALDKMERFPALPRNTEEIAKSKKEELVNLVKELKEVMSYDSLEAVEQELKSTISNQEEIIAILKELDKRLNEYKTKEEIYNFTDISRLAIKIVEDNKEVREELRDSFQEIMVDEYQDTSDTQEKFISLIAKNNVYMVGDIKQSIYRFRNANPYLFKEKYDSYRDTDQGIKIDLLNNFRSRREVLEDINDIFRRIMDDKIGGADYHASHEMAFGLEDYETTAKTKDNHHLDLLTYTLDKTTNITKDEQEAFIIAENIKDKINNNYLVYDKSKKSLRPIEYKDIVILLDKSKNFDLFKKIFEYLGIPLTILKEESLSKDDDILVIKNLLNLIVRIYKQDNYDSLKYSFLSVARSYLFNIPDKEIYDLFVNNNLKESPLYQMLQELSKLLEEMSPVQFFDRLIKEIHYEEKLITLGNMTSSLVRIEYIHNLIESLEQNGYTLEDIINHLDQIFESGNDLKFNVNTANSNSVKIMTIHKSKGLEFPVCYFAGFASRFNLLELKEKIIFDNEYGIILPVVDGYYKDTILKTLVKERSKIEEIGERIRLFYVALTRAREKIIIVTESIEEQAEKELVSTYTRSKYNSFQAIIKSIYSTLLPYEVKVTTAASKDYLLSKNKNNKDSLVLADDKLIIEEINIETKEVEHERFSKDHLALITKEEDENMKTGTLAHEVLERLDFKNPNLENIEEPLQSKIRKFLQTPIISNHQNANFYKEYEFIDEDKNGIIDLLIEEDNEMIIVDYKFKNINDEAYDNQLNGYRNYIKKKTGKKTTCYLYSIMEGIYRLVEEQ